MSWGELKGDEVDHEGNTCHLASLVRHYCSRRSQVRRKIGKSSQFGLQFCRPLLIVLARDFDFLQSRERLDVFGCGVEATLQLFLR